jgi:wyosine [tRNA(Phe)-imidazoG37] synthetase (radical SAM superfamily)
VGSALANALRAGGAIDSVTLSGNGEPTLHPHFGAVVAEVIGAARRTAPKVPVRILTNGTQVLRPLVRRALDFLDERIVTMDAEPGAVNRAGPDHPFGERIAGVRSLRDVTLQSCFIEGAVSNTGAASVASWIDAVSEIRPRAVQVHTISRPAATDGVRAVPQPRLERIVGALWARTGIDARVFT